MRPKPHRIYLRSPLPFILTLSVAFMAFLFAVAFFNTPGPSKVAAVYPMVLLFFLAYVVHRASLSWIRISEDGKELVSVPSWFSRKLLGQKGVFARTLPGSELLFCRQMAYGALNGYYIILRVPSGSDQVLWETELGVSRRWWNRTANEIQARHQMSARLITQTVSAKGREETEWTPESDKLRWKLVRPMAGAAILPWLGVPARDLTANPRAIVSIGLVLWAIGCLVYRWIFRTQQIAKDPSLTLTILVTSIQFFIFYVVAVLVTGSAIGR